MFKWGGLMALIDREIYRFACVFTQTVAPPIVTSFLFIFIFGFALGKTIHEMAGFPYLVFMVPGLIALYLIESTYTNSCSSLFLSRWSSYIQELLVTPLAYVDLVIAITIGSIARGFFTCAGVYLISLLFSPIPIAHPGLLAYLFIAVGIIFSSLGVVVGLVSEEWEHLAVMTNFVITPLTYFGGVFTSIQNAPSFLVYVSHFNPFFYMVDSIRFSMLGSSDTSITVSTGVVTVAAILFFSTAVWLFKIGYKLRS